jgi:hypothetical protein
MDNNDVVEFCVVLRPLKADSPLKTFTVVISAPDLLSAKGEADQLVTTLCGLVEIVSIDRRRSRSDC